MKFSSKSEFVLATQDQWELLWSSVDRPGDKPVTQAQLKQILAHLHSWHELLLTWYRVGMKGAVELPAPGFNWKQTRELNKQLDAKYEDISLASIRRRLKLSHGRVMKLVASLNERQFSKPGQFHWTGSNPLASYIVPNTFSHYRWAIKKIKKLPCRS